MDVEEQVDAVRQDADHQRLDCENLMDDEVTLLHHRRDTDVTDIPGSDIRDELNTQRGDWLLQTEALHGARPRRITRERCPLSGDQTGVMDLEAAGGTGGQQLEHHGFQAPLLSPERHILMEEEVITPPRGAVRLRCRQVGREPCLRFSRKSVHTGGPDRQKDIARMQVDLADLCADNRMLRTPRVSQTVRAPRQAEFTTTKVPRFDGTTSWEQYKQVFDAIVRLGQ